MWFQDISQQQPLPPAPPRDKTTYNHKSFSCKNIPLPFHRIPITIWTLLYTHTNIYIYTYICIHHLPVMIRHSQNNSLYINLLRSTRNSCMQRDKLQTASRQLSTNSVSIRQVHWFTVQHSRHSATNIFRKQPPICSFLF